MPLRLDEDARIIHTGATIPQLAEIFRVSEKTIRSKLAGRVAPTALRGASSKDSARYLLADVAPLLCEPETNIEQAIKTLTPNKLPPLLQDAFWKAQRTRLEVEEKLGNLWNTERVVSALADAFKPCRMAILMFREQVEQQHELTEEVRTLIETMCDSLLNAMHQSLVEKFSEYEPAPDEHGMPLATRDTEGS